MSRIIYSPFLSYLRVAARAHDEMVSYLERHSRSSVDVDDFPDTADGQATIVVLYTAIALECYIFNYAARKLGETYCRRHIDSMNHHTKWLLVPKLATGRGIPADDQSIVLLRQLIAARNSVAHAKAVNVSVQRWEEQKERIVATNRSVLAGAFAAFKCVGELGAALVAIDPAEPSAQWLAGFQAACGPSIRFSDEPGA